MKNYVQEYHTQHAEYPSGQNKFQGESIKFILEKQRLHLSSSGNRL